MTIYFEPGQITMNAEQTRPVRLRGNFALNGDGAVSDQVKTFLSRNANALPVPFGTDSLVLAKEADSAGRRVLRYYHVIDGVPVFGAETIAVTDAQSRLHSLDLYAGATKMKPTVASDRSPLDAAAALEAAKTAVGATQLRTETPAPRAIWFPSDSGLVRAFEVILATTSPAHDWQIIVDAQSGAILSKRDLIQHMPDGSGLIFDPNPVVTSNNNTLRDPTATIGACGFAGTAIATLDAQRVARPLKDLTVTGGNFTLSGPFCQIHDFAAPAGPNPTEASGNFNYSMADNRFNAVMVYHHVDSFQRYLQSIGITNAHNSVIRCDPLDSDGYGWFSPVDMGLHFGGSGPCKPDRATDADCMIHEYQHAIQNDLVPGWGVTNPVTGREEAGAMGEGAGDFVACCYFADRGGGFQREVFEDYVFAPAGLRRVDGHKVYPADWAGEVHSDGEIWSAALWNIYRAIGGDLGSAAAHEAARQAMFRSLFESYPLLATSASLPDGAEALMTTNAALDAYRGQHLREMLQSFHDRGILPVAAGSDLYVADDASDPGTTAYHAPVFWDSPDIWVRNHDDGVATHQQPIAGHDNYLYCRVHNRGTVAARAYVVTFNVKLWLGTEFVYPGDFVPSISAAPGFNLAPGASHVVKVKWPAALVPAANSHGCILVSVFTPAHAVPSGAHVWEQPALAQRNVTILVADAGDTVSVPFRLGSRLRELPLGARLEVKTASRGLKLAVLGNAHTLELLFRGGAIPGPTRSPQAGQPPLRVLDPVRVALAHAPSGGSTILHLAAGSAIAVGDGGAEAFASTAIASQRTAELQRDPQGRSSAIVLHELPVAHLPVTLPPRSDLALELRVTLPKQARSGEEHVVDIVQRDAKNRITGGVRIRLTAR